RVPHVEPGDLDPRPTLALCAAGVGDPGNLGTLVRSAAAAGAECVVTVRGTVSPRNPKAVRASAGAFFRLPVLEAADLPRLVELCRARGLRLWRTDPREGIEHWAADLTAPAALLVGGEAAGLPALEFSGTTALRIPMRAGIESLNVASVGAILLFEAVRQRV